MGIQCPFFVDFLYGMFPYLMGGFCRTGVLAAILAGEYRRFDTKSFFKQHPHVCGGDCHYCVREWGRRLDWGGMGDIWSDTGI